MSEVVDLTIYEERVKAWIKALRSDKYEQGFGGLCQRKPDSKDAQFCCLGVACDISHLSQWQDGNIKYGDNYFVYCGVAGPMPEPVREFYGLNVVASERLSDANDTGIPFNVIASRIEKGLEDGSIWHEDIVKG